MRLAVGMINGCRLLDADLALLFFSSAGPYQDES